jgi:phospholipase C
MDYYDGNTVTGLWNYAQHYAMSDNFYDTEFGPSTPGRSTWFPARPAAPPR